MHGVSKETSNPPATKSFITGRAFVQSSVKNLFPKVWGERKFSTVQIFFSNPSVQSFPVSQISSPTQATYILGCNHPMAKNKDAMDISNNKKGLYS